ncbi:MAG: hypothetical protein K2X90_01870 [Candidatus Babeliaceae bacterium]|nr:hypothetical protein [Candidatus Babeliaceae bacterium]
MSKYFLTLCAFVSFVNISAVAQKTSAEQLMAFNTMELGPKGHKGQWGDHMQKCLADKTNLKKKHHEQRAELKNSQIKNLAEMQDCSHAAREKFFQGELKEAIKLHKKQMAEWEKMCKKHMDDAMKIAAKQKDDLAKFEAQL